jgi:hypothetical protein
MDHVGEKTAALLKLGLQLRTAAADADRPDVVEEADRLLRLIAGEQVLAGAEPQKNNTGVAETVQRILNGLGF